jgi:hypothetical protein
LPCLVALKIAGIYLAKQGLPSFQYSTPISITETSIGAVNLTSANSISGLFKRSTWKYTPLSDIAQRISNAPQIPILDFHLCDRYGSFRTGGGFLQPETRKATKTHLLHHSSSPIDQVWLGPDAEFSKSVDCIKHRPSVMITCVVPFLQIQICFVASLTIKSRSAHYQPQGLSKGSDVPPNPPPDLVGAAVGVWLVEAEVHPP